MIVELAWNGSGFKTFLHTKEERFAMKVGFMVEKQAKINITEGIYNRPQIGSYTRTGNARASIHTEFNAEEMAVYVGSDQESLQNAALGAIGRISTTAKHSKRTIRKMGQLFSTATGSSVFYVKWLEDGFHARNGRFIAGYHFLKNALYSVRTQLRGLK